MGWTAPRTWVDDEVESASILNPHLRDNLRWLGTDSPACRVYRGADLTVANNTLTPVPFTAERFDTASMHSNTTNNTRLTVPAGAGGIYMVGACGGWNLSTAGVRDLSIAVNGTAIVFDEKSAYTAAVGSQYYFVTSLSTLWAADAGDYFEFRVLQNSGGSLVFNASSATTPEFWAVWMHN